MAVVATADDIGNLGHFAPDKFESDFNTDLASNDSDQAATAENSLPSPWPEPADGVPPMPLPMWPGPEAQSSDCSGMMLNGCPIDWSGNYSTLYPGGPQECEAWMPGSRANSWRSWPRGRPSLKPKRRFCTLFPDVGNCRRGSQCTFAHSREEIANKLLEPEEERQEAAALTDDFFMYKYKTRWCPIGVQHEWHTCVYAHNYQDARRPVSIGYGAKLCPYWSKKDTTADYSQRCPLALRCPYSHGAKEQLYHPDYFKTVVCRDIRGKACPRSLLCAFYHNKSERRSAPAESKINYDSPLPQEVISPEWMEEFLSPPFLPEGSRQACDEAVGVGKADQNGGMLPYAPQVQENMYVQGQQQPCYFMMMPMGQVQSPTDTQWVFVPFDNTGGCVAAESGC